LREPGSQWFDLLGAGVVPERFLCRRRLLQRRVHRPMRSVRFCRDVRARNRRSTRFEAGLSIWNTGQRVLTDELRRHDAHQLRRVSRHERRVPRCELCKRQGDAGYRL
jgi:hypothetical protein